ncbi:MAG: hypothetical protein PHH41_11080 [Sulfurimonas sp.]|nr:hypothetical protein [Sulfurimonas sp.]
MKEKINESVLNFSKNSFDELDEVYEKMGIKSDIQIKEFDISSFADVKSADEGVFKIPCQHRIVPKIVSQI